MEIIRASTGSGPLDSLLCGGLETDIITTAYGPAGSGKTTVCLMASIAAVQRGRKVIFADTEGGFSVERIRLLGGFCEEHLKSIMVIRPNDFQEQNRAIRNISQMANEKIGLVVVDTISMLYRIECGRNPDIKAVNNEMGIQISMLSEISRKKNIPVLVTNQVYSDFEIRDRVKMVGGDILKYSSKCLVELEKIRNGRKISVRKHRSLPENREILVKIEEKGFSILRSPQ